MKGAMSNLKDEGSGSDKIPTPIDAVMRTNSKGPDNRDDQQNYETGCSIHKNRTIPCINNL